MRDFIAGAQAVSSGIQSLQLGADPSARELRHLRATLGGYASDVRELRHRIDADDVRDALPHEWPEDVIRVWQLERRSRRTLVQMGAKIRELDAVAEILERGAKLRQYVSRSGDTWQSVAARLLGDWREWPRLVAANAGDPASLPPGAVIVVPG